MCKNTRLEEPNMLLRTPFGRLVDLTRKYSGSEIVCGKVLDQPISLMRISPLSRRSLDQFNSRIVGKREVRAEQRVVQEG